jgi:DNA polymerase I
MSDNRLFLLDGHALVYRAHFAFITRPLINSKGINTSAINGFTRTLWDLIRSEKPSHLAVVFDPSTPTFRHVMYEPYKANRESQPDDIRIAFPYIRKIVEGFNIPVLTLDGYEADDVIGTVAKQAEQQGYQVFMVTPDKDMGQLVSPNIFMYKPSRQGNGIEIWGEKEVNDNWGINRVEQVIDILGLQGDSVDNIPGIPGVGPKTAAILLQKYDSVENIIAHAEELKGKQRELVIQYAEQALLSKKLATIDTAAPVQFDPTAFQMDPINREALAEIFRELEFRSLANQILGNVTETTSGHAGGGIQGNLFDDSSTDAMPGPASHAIADKNINNTPHQYHLADTPEKRAELIQRLSTQTQFALDTETTSIDANQAELVGLSFAFQPGEAWYVPVSADQTEARAVVAEFKSLLENDLIEKTGQNIKYDAIVLKWYGINLRGFFFDTMIAHYLLAPELRHNMDYLAETYLHYKPVPITALIGEKGKKQLTMRDAPLEEVKEYAAEDADITWQLRHHFQPLLQQDGLDALFRNIESPLIHVLTDMEFEGVRIDTDFLAQYAEKLAAKINELETRIHQAVGAPFNISSPKQVGEILFDRLKMPYPGKKTKSGQYSTDEEILTDLSKNHPVAADILKHRGLQKLKSTYVDALPKLVNPRSGRVHSSFNQALTATGRLSSNNPNIQNIPIRTPEGAEIRKAFIPRDDQHVLLSADYSQIELRIIAEISGDEAMLEAFIAGQDIHSATAARVFGVPFPEVTTEQRYRAKTVNFSIIYGAGATNLSRQLDIKRAEATELIAQYFSQYPGLKAYMEKTVQQARDQGFVTTLMGRRRYLRDIHSKSSLERSNAERMAVNTPIQGAAADMVKMAMVNIHRDLQEKQLQTKMILQVHDELVFDVPIHEIDIVRPIIEDRMQHAMPNLKVPILVGMGTGKNWLEAH